MSKKLMIQGTASGVGKSMITTAICRVLYSDGYVVAPFKAQNMASRSYKIMDGGGEIGVGQAVQALACHKKPCVHMNPILIKPAGNAQTRLFIQGFEFEQLDYSKQKRLAPMLKSKIKESYDILEKENQFIVLEGAGSSAEINIDDDISNMGTAEMVDAPVILVADIDRGGVFASIYGTIMLQKPEQRNRIKGVIINKFRGKKELLQTGIERIEALTNVPVLGVMPYMPFDLEDEDAITEKSRERETETPQGHVRVYENESEYNRLEAVFREHIQINKLYEIFK